jgi:hypothetical protein
MVGDEKDSTYRLLSDDESGDVVGKTTEHQTTLGWLTRLHLCALLAISCCLNGLLVFSNGRASHLSEAQKPTEFGRSTTPMFDNTC